MTEKLKLASNLCPFSRLSDRFVTAGYTEGYDFRRQVAMLAAIDGISGTGFGWPCPHAAAMKHVMDDAGLALSTIDTDVYTDAQFKQGSLSNRDPKIRRAAIDRIKGAIDAAAEFGSPDINLWLGHDGFEYFFQGHYADVWKWIDEGLQEVSEYNPRVPISIEAKCKEPRAHSYVANTSTALLLVNKINKPHVGITLDFGHSLAALENPAEAEPFWVAVRENLAEPSHRSPDPSGRCMNDLSPSAP